MTTEELLWQAFVALRSVSPQSEEVAEAIWKIQVHGPWDNQAQRLVKAGYMDSNGHTILTGVGGAVPCVPLSDH